MQKPYRIKLGQTTLMCLSFLPCSWLAGFHYAFRFVNVGLTCFLKLTQLVFYLFVVFLSRFQEISCRVFISTISGKGL